MAKIKPAVAVTSRAIGIATAITLGTFLVGSAYSNDLEIPTWAIILIVGFGGLGIWLSSDLVVNKPSSS